MHGMLTSAAWTVHHHNINNYHYDHHNNDDDNHYNRHNDNGKMQSFVRVGTERHCLSTGGIVRSAVSRKTYAELRRPILIPWFLNYDLSSISPRRVVPNHGSSNSRTFRGDSIRCSSSCGSITEPAESRRSESDSPSQNR